MATQSLQDLQQDYTTPTYARINGTSWWGATIVGLCFAVFGFLLHLPQGNLLGPAIFTLALISSYLPMLRNNSGSRPLACRLSTAKTVLGIILMGLLIVAIFYGTATEKSGLFNLPLALITALCAGGTAFCATRFLLPSVRKIRD